MIHPFIHFLEKYLSLEEAEKEAIKASIPVKTFEKGSLLLKEGSVAQASYFIIEGCVRMYTLLGGEEKTTFFYTEHQFITSYKSLNNKLPADHSLECLEDSCLAVLSFEKERELLKQFPKFESLSRILLEEELSNYQEMLASYITNSPEQRYRNLLRLKPELVNRIPQYQLATYLGVKPESLSRIRKRIAEKKLS